MASGDTHRRKRQEVRRKMEAAGFAPDVIAAYIDSLREHHRQLREGLPVGPVRDMRARRTNAVSLDRQRALDRRDHEMWVEDRPRVEAETYARLSPDDSKHRARSVDPLLSGAARVSPATARAARRSKALTKHEYDQITGGS